MSCHSLIVKNWYYSITVDMSSNINRVKYMIDIRDGMRDVNDINNEICLN